MKKLWLSAVLCATLALTACGGGGGTTSAAPAAAPAPLPTFSSTPSSVAAEATAYSYQLAASDPSGGTITYQLTQSPAGVTLSGNTITWTPAPAQCRVANAFAVTATTASGTQAKQSWTVTPSGTVQGSWIDTYWGANGATQVPTDWTLGTYTVAALVPKPDGSLQTIQGSGNADGTFMIPNVPGGYYWLQIARSLCTPSGSSCTPVAALLPLYWTSSSTLDFGSDRTSTPLALFGSTSTTTFDITLTGLDPWLTGDSLQLIFPGYALPLPTPASGAVSVAASEDITTSLDWSRFTSGYLFEYEPLTVGSLNGSVLGPSATLTNLSLVNGATNTITAALSSSPQSFDISIKGTAWAPLFDRVAPTTVVPSNAGMSLCVQPYATADNAVTSSQNFALFSLGGTNSGAYFGINLSPGITSVQGVSQASAGFFLLGPMPSPCGAISSIRLISPVGSPAPAILTDDDFGNINYNDPFPAANQRIFSVSQQASYTVPIPTATLYYSETLPLNYGLSTSLPTAPIAPLISPVRNPTINGADLFSGNTFNNTSVDLSWSAPSVGTPYGYNVAVMRLITPTAVKNPDGTTTTLPPQYATVGVLGTAKTAITVPSSLLTGGGNFLFRITAVADARANMETSPRRSALPTGYADVLSAPVTIAP